jgi:tellurite resistance protein TerC
MSQSWAWWIAFNAAILVMLAIDLGVFHRRSHEVRIKEALFWSIVWTVVALVFNLGLWLGWLGQYGAAARGKAAADFLTGYLLERSLSFDNLFVFAVIFTYFAVQPVYHHRVLFYGILGALFFRAVFIFGGLWLIQMFEWMIYVFAAFLIFTGIKLAAGKEREIQPEKNPVLRLVRVVLPVSERYDAGHFFTRVDRRWRATPLLLVLLFLEMTDVMFALDSIPAIIGVTRDSFIVYTSNILAILGLRALYFVLAAFMRMFRYLSYGLACLLIFIGLKMIAEPLLHVRVPSGVSLAVVAVVLTAAVVLSCAIPNRAEDQASGSEPPE